MVEGITVAKDRINSVCILSKVTLTDIHFWVTNITKAVIEFFQGLPWPGELLRSITQHTSDGFVHTSDGYENVSMLVTD